MMNGSDAGKPAQRDQRELIIETIPDGVMVLERNGCIMFANAAAERILGLSRDEITGRRFDDSLWNIAALNGTSFPEEELPFNKIARTLQPVYGVEHTVARPDGAVVCLSVNAAPLFDREGAFAGIVQSFSDITERKHAEEELRFRSLLLDSATDSVFVLDTNGKMLYVNEAAYKKRGYTREELMDMPLHLLDAPEYAARVPERIEQMMRFGSIVFESGHIKKDGSVMPVEVHARLIEHEGRDVIVSIARDITERKIIEHQLKESEERYRTLIELSPDIVFVNSEGKIAYINTAGAKLLGAKGPEELMGKPAINILHPDFHAVVRERVRQVEQGLAVPPLEEKYIGLDGRVIDVEVAGFATTFQGKPAVQVVAHDITERKRSQALSDALNRINASITSTFSMDEIMRRVIIDSTEALGCEAAKIELREGDYWVVRYLYGLAPELIGGRFSDDEAKYARLVARTKRPFVSNDAYREQAANPELMKRFSIRSLLAIPLILRGDIIGVLVFMYRSETRSFTEPQIDFASKLGASVSLALENARLYATERNIADTLQEALLMMPGHIDGVNFGFLYRSATEAARVGGDFFDIFELERGKVGIVIGDVSGKGLEAAALTSIVKNAIKAHAYEDGTPALVMSKVNDLVTKVSSPSDFVTVFFGMLDVRSGKLAYCSAGHPPPIVKRARAGIEFLLKHSPIIGAFPRLHYRSAKTTLKKGDVLVLYTDGTVEARCDSGFFGEDRLISLLKDLRPLSTQKIPKEIFNEVMKCTAGRLSDDVALLTVSLDPEHAGAA